MILNPLFHLVCIRKRILYVMMKCIFFCHYWVYLDTIYFIEIEKLFLKSINNIKKYNEVMNSNKNKLNSKIILIFNH